MADRPITFSGGMVTAILDGRKTQTRRVIKIAGRLPEFCGGRYDLGDPTCYGWEDFDHGDWVTLEKDPGQRMGWRDCAAAYRPGDRLWVRETWVQIEGPDGVKHEGSYLYRADAKDNRGRRWSSVAPGDPDREVKWSSPIHMPRSASRITLIVEDVRVQRVQEISEADALAEGGRGNEAGPWGAEGLIEDFADLWNSLHTKEGTTWDDSPWVAAITFRPVFQNIDKVN